MGAPGLSGREGPWGDLGENGERGPKGEKGHIGLMVSTDILNSFCIIKCRGQLINRFGRLIGLDILQTIIIVGPYSTSPCAWSAGSVCV